MTIRSIFLGAAMTGLLTSGTALFAQSSLTCSSEDGGRHYCNADTRGGVRLVRQRSGSSCQEGRTWGYDNRGIWVDKGCRADFSIGDSANGGYNGPRDRDWRDRDGNGRPDWRDRNGSGANRQVQQLTCSSEDGGRHYCSIDVRSRVRLVRQRSGSSCEEGRTWGTDNRGLWVDRGCRADFEVVTR